MLMSDEMDFRGKKITRRGTLNNNKTSSKQEDIPVLHVYAPNYRALKHMKQKLKGLRGEIGKFLVVV